MNRLRFVAALGAGIFGWQGYGCGARVAPASAPVTVVASSGQVNAGIPATASGALPEATPAELALAKELREVVVALVTAGERNVTHEWNLAVATDDLVERLEGFGYSVQREGFTYNGALAQNLVVHVAGRPSVGAVTPGAVTQDAATPDPRVQTAETASAGSAEDRARELIVVGARYDSVPGSPGADDNATGVAALLALARRFAHTAPARTFRFVLFSDAAGRAYFEASGAFHHAQVLHQDPTYFAATSARFNEGMQAEFARGKVALMLELSGLGVYSLRSGSQAYPEGMPRVREAGDFVELTAYPEASALASEFAERFRSTCAVPVVTSLLLDHAAALPTSTHRAFLDYGVPALMLSDTLQRRSPDVGSPRDQLEGIDFDRLARVTLGIEAALQRLASH